MLRESCTFLCPKQNQKRKRRKKEWMSRMRHEVSMCPWKNRNPKITDISLSDINSFSLMACMTFLNLFSFHLPLLLFFLLIYRQRGKESKGYLWEVTKAVKGQDSNTACKERCIQNGECYGNWYIKCLMSREERSTREWWKSLKPRYTQELGG